METATLMIADDDVLEVGFEDRHDALLQPLDLGGVLIDAPGREPQLRQAGAGNQPDIARAYDCNPHCLLHLTWNKKYTDLMLLGAAVEALAAAAGTLGESKRDRDNALGQQEIGKAHV